MPMEDLFWVILLCLSKEERTPLGVICTEFFINVKCLVIRVGLGSHFLLTLSIPERFGINICNICLVNKHRQTWPDEMNWVIRKFSKKTFMKACMGCNSISSVAR